MTTSPRPHPAVPPQLAHLPMCPRRGLPVPYVNQRDDRPPDFSTIFGERVLACARDQLCGVCAQPLTYWVAFLGSRRAAEERAFLDPPMHEVIWTSSNGVRGTQRLGGASRSGAAASLVCALTSAIGDRCLEGGFWTVLVMVAHTIGTYTLMDVLFTGYRVRSSRGEIPRALSFRRSRAAASSSQGFPYR